MAELITLGQPIKQALEALDGDNRLDVSALKGAAVLTAVQVGGKIVLQVTNWPGE